MKNLIMTFIVFILAFSYTACKNEGVSLITVGLRDNPSSQNGKFKWVKPINRGQVVKILESQKDGDWMKIQLPDGETSGWVEKRFIHEGKKEIIEFGDKTKLFDQPDSESKPIAELSAGTKAIILKNKGDWSQVSITFDRKGWVKKGTYQASNEAAASKTTIEVYISGIGKCQIDTSSTLADSGGYSYSAANLFDKNPGTTWQEGADGSGVGEWIEITFPEPVSINVSMINGFMKKDPNFAKNGDDGDLYKMNNRVKSIKVEYMSFEEGLNSSTVSFEDELKDFQDAGSYRNAKKIKFIIDAVYKGSKWNDTCIGEIKIDRI